LFLLKFLENPKWRKVRESYEYERNLPGGVQFLARATLEEDGVLFHYEFYNQSDTLYDMIYAVVANENKTFLVTADSRFKEKTGFGFVKTLDEIN